MTDGEDEPKVTWGTATLKSGFSGVIRTSEIKKSDRSFGEKPPADQLHWVIEPTSYDEADESKWPQAWYNISESSRSKWAKLQERLETLKCLPKRSADELVGLEFEFERIPEMKFGKDRDGNDITSENVLMPKKLVRVKAKTKGEASASPAPSASEPAPVAPAKQPAPSETVDIESVIVQMVEKEPIVITDLYKKMNKDFGVSRTNVFRAIKSLQNQGLVKLDSEGGVLVKAEE